MNKAITIYDIADLLGLSPATVSRALKNDPRVNSRTIKKVAEAADAMGYQGNPFARSLRSNKTHIIGVILPRLASHFMSSAISGIEKIANQHGYNIIITQSDELHSKEIINVKTMFQNRVDGLIVSLCFNSPDVNHFKNFFDKDIPVIFFDRVPDSYEYPAITIDNVSASFKATEHLILQGCQYLVHMTANTNFHIYKERYEGFKQAMLKYGKKVTDRNLLFNTLDHQSGLNAAEQIIAMKKRPDGIVAANDNGAVACMIALKSAGIRIPEDIAFVGFNNDPVAEIVEPKLSTVSYSGYDIGLIAAQNLIQQLLYPDTKKTLRIIIRSELIIRRSSIRSI
ncbi:LacI family DNA-binding transcriptional regulator [Niabella yanshanensis]|uniref:LacI family DNA-binding transcriptional regulator n=1 Tax=Niabella yanshanensis TaxID=577386 RepID=A0ABZ0W617_9BACT|nr:LacI family DNA-binding transcriptional regulator [Niabella yanshanensis]WQD38705.1 LacI family DNA-binding transcriptional regulator [Niabella yanshanensis]